jgi:uncharacterized protein YceH (UPF0502 family)
MTLDPASLRVLGALMEKEMMTPDLYPLSLNALVAAANQRSSRDPVMNLTDDDVRSALDVLGAHELVTQARDGGRVPRYEHRIRTVLNLRRDETAVLCLLLLRGAQTPGELRGRADRMHTFDDLAAVQSTLDRLAARDIPLVLALSRAPGSREIRTAHLLGESQPSAAPQPADELSELRAAVQTLTARIEALEQRFAAQP